MYIFTSLPRVLISSHCALEALFYDNALCRMFSFTVVLSRRCELERAVRYSMQRLPLQSKHQSFALSLIYKPTSPVFLFLITLSVLQIFSCSFLSLAEIVFLSLTRVSSSTNPFSNTWLGNASPLAGRQFIHPHERLRVGPYFGVHSNLPLPAISLISSLLLSIDMADNPGYQPQQQRLLARQRQYGSHAQQTK